MPRSHLFVVPSASALPTGGNLYNDGLLAALIARGAGCARCSIDELSAREVDASSFESVWIDSLYLDRIAELAVTFPRSTRCGLLLHALPSTLARAAGRADVALLEHERAALLNFDCALVTSDTSARELAPCAPHLVTWLLEPAIHRGPEGQRAAAGSVSALLVANLTPNKGVLPFLRALGERLLESDEFALRCIGRFDLDPAYGEACRRALEEQPMLAARVVLTGVRAYAEVLAELAHAHILISASRVESFGMAIADARASGCVVLARAGGHVAHLVDGAAGGSLVTDDAALAELFLTCVRDRAALDDRLRLAAARRLAQRSWDDVARAFLAYAEDPSAARKVQ